MTGAVLSTRSAVQLTDAYTESMNGLIRLLNRIGRGYSFKILQAKMFLAVEPGSLAFLQDLIFAAPALEKVQSKHQKDNFICNRMLENLLSEKDLRY